MSDENRRCKYRESIADEVLDHLRIEGFDAFERKKSRNYIGGHVKRIIVQVLEERGIPE